METEEYGDLTYGYIGTDFIDANGDCSFSALKSWEFNRAAGHPVWKPAAIKVRRDNLTVAELPTFREQLAEVESEARRLDEQYPPGSPVALNPPADAA